MKHIFVTLFFSAAALFSSAQTKTNFTQQDYDKYFLPESVPKDLKKDNHILMVWTVFKQKEEKENAEIKAIFDTYYKGKFVICPLDYRKLDNAAVYDDAAIYKYTIMITPKTEREVHLHYSLTLLDNTKKRGDAKPAEGYLIETGLEDAHKKLNKMLSYYAERLNAAKD